MAEDNASDRLPQWALDLIRCPVTKEPLRYADEELVARMTQLKSSGQLLNEMGANCDDDFDAGLVNVSNTFFHLVNLGIPTLIPGEAIPMHPD